MTGLSHPLRLLHEPALVVGKLVETVFPVFSDYFAIFHDLLFFLFKNNKKS